MKRLEPNLLLAITTGFAMILVLMTTSVYGAPGAGLRNVLLAIGCASGFVLLNPLLFKLMNRPARPPMIHPDHRNTVLWSSLFPMVVILLAGVPLLLPGQDHGLLVVLASVWFGATIESALKARKAS